MAPSQLNELDLSVVIPARNERKYISAALASIVEQTRPRGSIEAIVVDNGSCDGTADVVRQFGEAHPWFPLRLLVDPIPGTARARNQGAAVARGHWLLFLDADSRLAPDLSACVVAHAEAGLRAGDIRIVADTDDRIDRAFFRLLEFGKVLFHIRAQMFYCERAVFAAAGGFDEALRVGEDRDLLVRLYRSGVRVGHVADSWIATSPRRLHTRRWRLGLLATFGRWALAHAGIGRHWRY